MAGPLMLTMILGLGAVALLWFGLRARARSSVEEIAERMEAFAGFSDAPTGPEASGNRRDPGRVARNLDRVIKGRSMAERLADLLARADVRMTPGELLLLRLTAAGGGFLVGFVISARLTPALALVPGIIGALAGYAVPAMWLSLKARRRQKAFINQLGDTIFLMANSLRAGYSLLQTMEMVSRETHDPIATEFRRVVREVGLGISTQEAMDNLVRRVPSDDLDLLVTAINIQHEVGGNLAQILQILGHTIRERVRIKGEIQVLTAQQRISGVVISMLPVALAGVIFLMNPSYMMELFAWPWICMPIASGIMVIIGYLVMRKITAIEV
jgi:tight adherence protein B